MARKTVEQRLSAWESTPVVNSMNAMAPIDVDKLSRLIRRLHMPRGSILKRLYRPQVPCIERVQRQHGPQDYCWVGGSSGRRYYVWEFGDRARVFVHNEGGISFEVNVNLSPLEGMHELRKFVARMEGRTAS